jgi:hypothetical protein
MIKVTHVMKHGHEYYISDDHSVLIQREDGLTPFGNPMNMRWVMREHKDTGWRLGKMIDFDKYRHDLFERNNIIVDKHE